MKPAEVIASGLRKGTLHQPRIVRERCPAVLFGENGGLFSFGERKGRSVGHGIFCPDIMASDNRLDTLSLVAEKGVLLALYFVSYEDIIDVDGLRRLVRPEPYLPLDMEARAEKLTFTASEEGVWLVNGTERLALHQNCWQSDLGSGELLVAPAPFFAAQGWAREPLRPERRLRPSALAV